MTRLTGSNTPIDIAPGGYALQAPGVVGDVEELSPQASATRSDSGLHEPALLRAIENAGIFAGKLFELRVDAVSPLEAGATRSGARPPRTRTREDALVFAMPHLDDEAGYAVLYTDEAGVSRWVLPSYVPDRALPGSRVTFHLPREAAPVPPEALEAGGASRGPISKIGRRVVRVLAWSASGVVGQGVLAAAEQWEAARRPYGFHMLQPERYTAETPLGEPVDWDWLRQGRALLLLHGTFSSAEASYPSLGRETLQALNELYQGRVFAFNHPSLHHSPDQNVQTLLDMLPDGLALELDLLTHSRGGLVGRVLAERLHRLDTAGRQVRVRRAVLAASPNQGTILSDPEHGLDLLDRYTNLLTNLPDNAYTLAIEGVLAVVKLLAYGALTGLPGLRCLLPGGDYLKVLNQVERHNAVYYALAAHYTPDSPALLARMGKRLGGRFVDSIFRAQNDAVVPTRGSYHAEANTFGFPIPGRRRRVFSGREQVHHTNYFSTPAVRSQIVEWLAK
jgi:hypothetical protein